jgi:hypothetical protein
LAVYFKAKRFPGFSTTRTRLLFLNSLDTLKHNHISSITERKALALAQKAPVEFMNFTSKQLVRIYPAGTRVNSSNYDPIPYWSVGCQVVALNFQTFGSQS